jgi:hypothetical protein
MSDDIELDAILAKRPLKVNFQYMKKVFSKV